MVSNVIAAQILSWDEVKEKLEDEFGEIYSWSKITDEGELAFRGNVYFWDLINDEFAKTILPNFENFDDFIYKNIYTKDNYTDIKKIKAKDIIHIQNSVEVEKLKEIYNLVKTEKWDDNYGEYPDVFYLEEIDKYLVYNGNHRTTIFSVLDLVIKCNIYENKFMSKLLNLALMDIY